MIRPPLPTIDAVSLRRTVEMLSAWRTRHSASAEFRAAATWLAGEFEKIPGTRVECTDVQLKAGPRVRRDVTVPQLLCHLEPTTDSLPGLMLIGAHLDSINMSGAADLTSLAPGANDDASGIAATLEVARIMAGRPRRHPMVFVAFAGEEQGLVGSAALAERAKREGWTVDAMLSNDMIGNTRNAAGMRNDAELRLFSDASPLHQSRELARWMEWLQRTEGVQEHCLKLVFRADRFGRGGDHTPFNRAGFTAVRLTEAVEDYSIQHTPDDVPRRVDFPYLARNAAINLLVVDRLANAGPPPTNVLIDRAPRYDATISWSSTSGVEYVVYWRDTIRGSWEHSQVVGAVDRVALPVDKDNAEFAVGAVGGIPVVAV